MKEYGELYDIYGKMTDDELKSKQKELVELRYKASESFSGSLKGVISKYAEQVGVKDIEVRNWHNDIYNNEVGKFKDDSHDSWDFDLRIDRWHNHGNRKDDNLHISVNIGVGGAFTHSEENQIEKFSVFGNIVKNLKKIEDELLNLDSFKTFDETEMDVYVINSILEDRERKRQAEEEAKKRSIILSKIAVGTVIDMRPEEEVKKEEGNSWWSEQIARLKNRKIEWMTEKNVRFDNDYGRTKIDVVVDNLVSGKWKIKA